MKANQRNFESFLGLVLNLSCAAAWPRPLMSALPPRADMCSAPMDVRYGPLTSDLRLDAPQKSSLRYSMRPAAAYAI